MGSHIAPSANPFGGKGGRRYAAFPSGTQMLFLSAAAPIGWARVTTNDDCLLRINGASILGNGGSNGFVASFNSQTQTGSQTISAATTGTGAVTGSQNISGVATGTGAVTGSQTISGVQTATGSSTGSQTISGVTTAASTSGATSLDTTLIPAHTHTYTTGISCTGKLAGGCTGSPNFGTGNTGNGGFQGFAHTHSIPALTVNNHTVGPLTIPALTVNNHTVGPLSIPTLTVNNFTAGPLSIPSLSVNSFTAGPLSILTGIKYVDSLVARKS